MHTTTHTQTESERGRDIQPIRKQACAARESDPSESESKWESRTRRPSPHTHTHAHSLSLTLSENVQQSASARINRWPVLVRACVSERVPYRVIACLYPPLLLCSSRAPARTIVPKETTTQKKYKQQQQAKPQSVIHTNICTYMYLYTNVCAYKHNCRIVYKFVLYLLCFFLCFHCFCHFIFNCSR